MRNKVLSQDNLISYGYNKSTKVFVNILGILTGLGGIGHGVFEILQGNIPTTDILERMGAFTIIPNYFLTGIAAIIVSSIIIFWTICFIHKKHGPIVFLLLSITLFIVGGGIAMIICFLITWIVSTRINKPLLWWRKIFPKELRKKFAKLWSSILISGFLLFSIGIGIWVMLTPPGETNQINIVDYICWSFLCIGFFLLILSILFGFARDIEN